MRAWIVALAVAASGAAGPAGAQEPLQGLDPTPERREEVLAFIEAYYETMSARDWDGYAAFFQPGAVIATLFHEPGRPEPDILVHTIEEFVEMAPEGPGSREIFEERMETATVLSHGELAHVWARYTARFGDPGEIVSWRGIDSFSLLRMGDRWQIVSLTFGALDEGVPDAPEP